MNYIKSILCAVLAIAILTPSFATTYSVEDKPTSPKAIKELNKIVKSIDFDLDKIGNKTIKVHFMVNTANEVVVLRTNNSRVDELIKFNLNYKSLESRDLQANKVYILPISFQDDTNT